MDSEMKKKYIILLLIICFIIISAIFFYQPLKHLEKRQMCVEFCTEYKRFMFDYHSDSCFCSNKNYIEFYIDLSKEESEIVHF